MKDDITKLNAVISKVLAYGPPRKNAEKQKKRVKKAKIGKKRGAA